jgi:hypothetical protein
MAKLKKPEIPPISMTIDKGRLVPASARAQETMDQFRNGAVVSVYIVQEVQDVRRKRYFAIVSNAVKNCNTPWKTTNGAHRGLKRALEVFDEGVDYLGRDTREEKSLNDLTHPEFEEYERNAYELLSHITGVDVTTLGKEATAWSEPEPDEDPYFHPDAQEVSPDVIAPDEKDVTLSQETEIVAAGQMSSHVESDAAEGPSLSSSQNDSAPPIPPSDHDISQAPYLLSDDDREILLTAGRMMIAATPSIETLQITVQSVKAICADVVIHADVSSRLNKIKEICKSLCEKDAKKTRDQTLNYIAGICGCEVRDLL